jgi:hypothetical protein
MARSKFSPRKSCRRPPSPVNSSEQDDGNSDSSESEPHDTLETTILSNHPQYPQMPNIMSELSTLKEHLIGATEAIEKIMLVFGDACSTDVLRPPTRKRTVSTNTDPEPVKSLARDLSTSDQSPSTSGMRMDQVPRIAGNVKGWRSKPCSSPGKTELFVTNVHRTTSVQDLTAYVSSYVPDAMIQKVSHNAARYQSFILTVSACHIKVFMEPYFWPNGIQCRRFIRPMSGWLAVRGCI